MSEAPKLDPRTTALLVLDYQPGILGSLPETEQLLDRAERAIATVRRAGGHIGYVRVAFTDADFAAIPEHSMMASAITPERRPFMRADAPTTAVHERIAPESGDIQVRKTRFGSFSTTDLAAQLRERGIETLLIAGVATSGAVLSTVRDAADRDYRLVVLSDICADADPEMHDFLTERVLPRQAYVTETERLERLFG